MSCAHCSNYLFAYDLAVSNIVELELLGLAEMLKYLSVFISHCNSHNSASFPCNLLGDRVIKSIVSARNDDASALDQSSSELLSCTVIDRSDSRSRHVHLLSALFLRFSLIVDRAYRFKLVK